MSFRELLEKGQIAEFPALQLALGAIKGRVDRFTVASIGTGGSKEEYPLVEIQGTATSYQVKVLEDSPEYLDWLNSALLCAGFVTRTSSSGSTRTSCTPRSWGSTSSTNSTGSTCDRTRRA